MVLILVSFVVGFVIAVPTMGPASAIIIRRVVSERYREALAFAGGSALAEGLACLAAIWGIELAMYTIPNLKLILEWGGLALLIAVGGYLLYGDAAEKSSPDEVRRVNAATLGGETIGGFAMTAFNPTLIATWTTLFGVVVSTLNVDLVMWQRWAIPVAVMLGEFAWFGSLVFLARRFGAYIEDWVVAWIIRGIGGLLIVIGLVGLVQKLVGNW